MSAALAKRLKNCSIYIPPLFRFRFSNIARQSESQQTHESTRLASEASERILVNS